MYKKKMSKFKIYLKLKIKKYNKKLKKSWAIENNQSDKPFLISSNN